MAAKANTNKAFKTTKIKRMRTAHLPELQAHNRFTTFLHKQTTKALLLVLLFVGGMVGEGWGQLSITTAGSAVTQNFDGLPSTGTGLSQSG